MENAFKHIVNSNCDPIDLVFTMLELCSEVDNEKIRKWTSTSSKDSIQKTVRNIIKYNDISDEWQFRYHLVLSICGSEDQEFIENEAYAYACYQNEMMQDVKDEIKKETVEPDDTIVLSDQTIIGEHLKHSLDIFIKRIIASNISSQNVVFVITGEIRSGLSTITQYVGKNLRRYGFKVSFHNDTNQSTGFRYNDNRDVVIMDDAELSLTRGHLKDLKLWNQNSSRFTTCILATHNIASISNILENHETITFKIPEYTTEDIIDIITDTCIVVDPEGMVNNISRDSIFYIINTLRVIGISRILPSVMDIVNYSLVNDEYYINSDGNAVIERKSIVKNIRHCFGRTIEISSDDVNNNIYTRLSSRIIGQDKALKEITPLLTNISMGFVDPGKPAGVILAVGPTGVGKSEFGKLVADIIFSGKYIKEDMNLYYSHHMASKFIGSPPGYVGSQNTPPLLQFIKNNPEGGVILLDEFEKAHISIQNIIMEFLDTGYISSATGEVFDARRFLIVLTSNAAYEGKDEYKETKTIGFTKQEKEKQDISKILGDKEIFNKSFLGRVKLIEFDYVVDQYLEEISHILLNETLDSLSLIFQNIEDIVKDRINDFIARICESYERDRGVRSMKEYLIYTIKPEIIDLIKRNEYEI